MMERARLYYLMDVYRNGTASETEREELLQWYQSTSFKDAEYPDSESEVELRILARLLTRMDEQQPRPRQERSRRLSRIIRYAAASVAVIAVAIFSYNYFQDSPQISTPETTVRDYDVRPGGNRAQLILSDGRTINLSSDQSGIIVGDTLIYTDGQEVVDTESNGSMGESLESASLVSLATPNGGEYRVTLSDGTNVWLNASSVLRYPVRFTGPERIVELEGEAYFEVSDLTSESSVENRFFVKTADQTIEVLGTSFNVNAYRDEVATRTTLVEGRIQLSTSLTRHLQPLFPGEQAMLNEHGEFIVKNVDSENFTAWKDGRFSFEGKSFAEVMRALGRWYNLDIVYEGDIPEKSFYGAAYRSSQLSIVMRLLRSADVDFRQEGRQLIIRNNQS